jgi:hypothetical protein
MYPQEKVHDREWVKKMGFSPSIMDYARFNYVAQPEDKIDMEDLVPRVGPYDIWAIGWGYKPIAGAKSPEDEKPTLSEWAREQDKTPWYRFNTTRAGGADPGELTEAVGDADSIKSTALGLKNLQRVAKLLLPATTTKEGEPYDDLAELYGRMLGQWTIELNHVAAIVGGFNTQEKYVGQEGALFTPVPKARQEEAVKFLNENAFATPMWAVDPEILRRIEPTGVLGRIRNAQNSVLNNLLSSVRFARLVEQEALDGSAAYTPTDFVLNVRKGIWKELDGPQVKIDAYRRNLQRAYLDLLDTKLNVPPRPVTAAAAAAGAVTSSGDEQPLYRAELRDLNTAIAAALVRTSDKETKAHLQGARDQIARILDPKFETTRAVAPGAANRTGFEGFDPFLASPDQLATCWPDYIILP